MASLSSRSITAAMWGSGGSAVRVVLQFATQVLLARILGPEEFGIFAIGAIVISFSNFFADVGIAYGLIQKKDITDDDVRFVFTWQVVIGTFTTLAIVFASKPIATFFGNEKAENVVAVLSVLCLIHALTAPSNNLLKRRLDFKPMQMGQIVGYIIGYIAVGLPFALAGYGVWSLVIAWITLSLINLGIQYASARHPLKPLIWLRASTSMMNYGAAVFATNILNWLILNIDRTLVGRAFSTKEMGLYSTAYNVLFNPTGTLVGIIQPVFFSASAHVSDDMARVRSAYSALVGTTLLLFLPCFGFMAAVAPTIILALYGNEWQSAADMFRPFALAMPLYVFTSLTTPIIWTSGRGLREFTSQIPLAVVWIAACWLAVAHSATAVAWTVLVLYAIRSVVIGREAIVATGVTAGEIWRVSRGAILLSLAVAVAAVMADEVMRQLTNRVWLWLGGDLVVAGLAGLLALRYAPSIVSDSSVGLLSRLAERFPRCFVSVVRGMFVRKG